MFCLLQKVRLFRIYLCLYKERHNHPLKGLIAFEVRPPIKLISLLLPDRCFKINQTTFLPQTFRSSKFSVHSLAFSLFRSRLARIRQHSFLPKKMYFFSSMLAKHSPKCRTLDRYFQWCLILKNTNLPVCLGCFQYLQYLSVSSRTPSVSPVRSWLMVWTILKYLRKRFFFSVEDF